MSTTTVRVAFGMVAAVVVALLLVAIAVAQPGDDDTATPEVSTAPTMASTAVSATPVHSAEPAPDPTGDAPVPTETLAPPASTDSAGDDDEATGEEGVGDDEGEAGDTPAVGTTIATNPGGHCVNLPNDSDIVRNPDKHDKWIVGSCQPREDKPDGEEPPGEDDDAPPEGSTPSLNPAGKCVSLPNNSDIVRNPDKHPNWVIGGCDTPSE